VRQQARYANRSRRNTRTYPLIGRANSTRNPSPAEADLVCDGEIDEGADLLAPAPALPPRQSAQTPPMTAAPMRRRHRHGAEQQVILGRRRHGGTDDGAVVEQHPLLAARDQRRVVVGIAGARPSAG
jgi:hypothetical protein